MPPHQGNRRRLIRWLRGVLDLGEGEGGYIRRFRSMLFMLRFIIKVTRYTFSRNVWTNWINWIVSFWGSVCLISTRCYYNLLYLVIEGEGERIGSFSINGIMVENVLFIKNFKFLIYNGNQIFHAFDKQLQLKRYRHC